MTTRRSLLAGLALPAVLTACHPPVPAFHPRFAADHPDADLIALGERWRLETAAYEAACAHALELDETTERPEWPDAVFMHDADWQLGLGTEACHYRTDQSWFHVGEPGSATATGRRLRGPQTRLGNFPPSSDHPLYGKAQSITHRVPWPERQARADEIVAAYDAHLATVEAILIASGHTAAEAETDRLGDIVAATIAEIHAATAQTIAGLAVKAEVICSSGENGHDVERDALQLARNIRAMTEGAA